MGSIGALRDTIWGRIKMNVTSCSGWYLGLVLVLGCGGEVQPLGDIPMSGAGGNAGDDSTRAGKAGNNAKGGYAGAGGTSFLPGPQGTDACEDPCVAKIFRGSAASCKLCHTSKATDAGGLQSSGLDLESPNPAPRLKDVPAKHTDVVNSSSSCPVGDKLIDTANPEQSWLLKKLRGIQGTCGTQMPQPPTSLRGEDLVCMENYVYCVAGQEP